MYSFELLAAALASRGEAGPVATILGATDAAREAMESPPDEDEEAIRARALELVDGDGAIESARAEGRAMDLTSALELAEAAVRANDDLEPLARGSIRGAEPR